MKSVLNTPLFRPLLAAAALACSACALAQQSYPITHDPIKPRAAAAENKLAANFEPVADKALAAMKARAEELKIEGVAVIAYAEGSEAITSWSSKMVVVGKIKTKSTEKDPGNNLLAIAYSKASEMADTLKDSGSGVRPPMKGEFGWQGGAIRKGKTGYLIAAFSGGKSEDDVKVSQAGLDVLARVF